jgi:hypothetical protein
MHKFMHARTQTHTHTHACTHKLTCLMLEPLKATCPVNFLAGKDSPVRAA